MSTGMETLSESAEAEQLSDDDRLRKQATVSVLDDVLRAIDKDVAFFLEESQSGWDPGLYFAAKAIKVAAANVNAVGLKLEAKLLMIEREKWFRLLSDYLLLVFSKGKSSEEVDELRDLYGEFPPLPTDPDEVDDFLSLQKTRCTSQAEVIRRLVNRLKRLLNDRPVEGPSGNCRWQHNGKVTEESMRSGSSKMCEYLWNKEDRTASFEELSLPAHGDRDHTTEVDYESYRSFCKSANSFFKRNGIPLKVTARKGSKKVILESKE